MGDSELSLETRLDLHIHTNASDGNWSPEELIDEVIKTNLKLISITDHDTIGNVTNVKKISEERGLLFLEGVEVSSTIDGNLFHVLGYGFSLDNDCLNALLQSNITLEADNNKLRDDVCIDTLIGSGYRIDRDEYNSFEYGPEPTPGKQFRSKAIEFLIHNGFCKDRKDFFDRLYIGGTPVGFPKFPHPSEVIKEIKSAGGIPVLAHPVHRANKLSLIDTLELFKSMDIEGIECLHPGLSQDIQSFCLKWSRDNNLITTGGSDCHGNRMKGRNIGIPEITANQLTLGKIISKFPSRL